MTCYTHQYYYIKILNIHTLFKKHNEKLILYLKFVKLDKACMHS
jgi:hypothetical protein